MLLFCASGVDARGFIHMRRLELTMRAMTP
jgi:hypothetical protein